MSIDLPILRAVKKGKTADYCVWEPLYPIVVVGRGGRIEEEVLLENCKADNVPVYKRKTGGGSVVLSRGVLVFSLAKTVGSELTIHPYIEQVNAIIINFLQQTGFSQVSSKGISDVCINDKKIMGSGMFRSRKILFFQSSILVDPDLSLMDRYLAHPPKEPDYRKGRPHKEFVTTLKEAGWNRGVLPLLLKLDEHIERNIHSIF